ncbi:MAG TPA: hypothetical protein VFM81_08465 [Actinomycetota bacterium]|nr:hypothetical protein [Actinomycetota bacterium]
MRRLLSLVLAAVIGLVGAGLSTGFAAAQIAQEETLVLDEHSVNGRNVDLVGKPDAFNAGDRYLFRSVLRNDQDVRVGQLFVDCLVQFAKEDSCSHVYELDQRGTITALGMIPVSQLKLGGTWQLAITGGTGEFENVGGAATVVIVDNRGNSQHSLHLLP